MKTATQLQNIFIHDRETSGKKAGEFYHYVLAKIYNGHTVKDRICLQFKINPAKFNGYQNELPKKLQHRWQEIEAFCRKEEKEVTRRIDGRFEKYRLDLNEFLVKNGYLRKYNPETDFD